MGNLYAILLNDKFVYLFLIGLECLMMIIPDDAKWICALLNIILLIDFEWYITWYRYISMIDVLKFLRCLYML